MRAVIFLISLSLALLVQGEPIRRLGHNGTDVPRVRDISVMRQVDYRNVTQCVYRPEDKVIVCERVVGEEGRRVECPVVFEFPEQNHTVSFKVFGLGFVPELRDAMPLESVRYWLYPRQFDNNTYYSHTVIVKDGINNLHLYYGEKRIENFYGFRVNDLKSYVRLVELLREGVEYMIPVEGLDSNSTVPMIGEVLVYDKDVSKRWLLGYGFGLGLGGWGYGGLGYGGLGYGLWNPYSIFG